MTAKGHVENGVVVLDPPGALPEGALVEVYILAPPAQLPEPMARLTEAEKKQYGELHPFVQRMIGILPEDFDWEREREAHILEKYGPL